MAAYGDGGSIAFHGSVRHSTARSLHTFTQDLKLRTVFEVIPSLSAQSGCEHFVQLLLNTALATHCWDARAKT